jgi:predicted amidohydrolase
MKIALASPSIPKSLLEGLANLELLVADAASQFAEIICFPESYLPGYPGMGYSANDRSRESLQNALEKVKSIAKQHSIAIIIPMDWYIESSLVNLAFVVSGKGELLGYQTKNQLDPSEDDIWIPGTKRSLFELNGVKFGITICHEGFRYPESVRWAAQNSAAVVFHPHYTGSDTEGVLLTDWGDKSNPYYEKAMMMRALENTIYIAGVNYCSKYSESASAIIDPAGKCLVHAAYGESGVIYGEIDPGLATGLLAKRFKNYLYND